MDNADILGGVLKTFAENGWDGIEQLGASRSSVRTGAKAAEAQDRERFKADCAVLAKALGDEDGRAAMIVLARWTIARPSSLEERAAARSAEHYAILKAIREGQENIFFTIIEMLRVASGAEPQTQGASHAETEPL